MTADAGRRAGVTGQAGRPAETAGGERPRARRLLDAAEQVFGERTYRGSTVADICARAGIATGSFYAHFDSKAEIFSAVVRQINEDLRQAIRAAIEAAGDGQRDLERASFRAFFTLLSQRPWIDRIVREAEFVAPAVFREYYEHLTRGYARGVRQAQLNREVPDDVVDDVLEVLRRGLPPRDPVSSQ